MRDVGNDAAISDKRRLSGPGHANRLRARLGAATPYGYFLTPSGGHARFWILTCPFWVGITCMSICSIIAVVLGWHTGARRSFACMIPWWIAGLVIFAQPSMYLDAQGNASLFI